MKNHKIGDNVYLRRLADLLQPKDLKVLPDEVDVGNWVPVIPYDTTLNVPDIFQVQVQGNQTYISTNSYNVSIGSESFASDPDIILPAGYIYELDSVEMYLDTNAAVTSGDHLTIDVIQNMDRWPIVYPGGVLNAVTTHYRQRQNFYQQNPFRLSSGSTEYSWMWPNGYFKNYDTDNVSYTYKPDIKIYCPDNSKFGTSLQFIIKMFNTSHVAKSFDAGATLNLDLIFNRKVLHGLNVAGILDITPP